MKTIAIKGFRRKPTLLLGGVPLEEGVTYRASQDDRSTLEHGFQAYLPDGGLLELFEEFPPSCSRYFEVELSGQITRNGNTCQATEMTLLREVSAADLLEKDVSDKDDEAFSSDGGSLLLSGAKEGTLFNSGERSLSGSSHEGGRAVTAGRNSVASVTGDGSLALCSGPYSVAGSSGYGSSALADGLESLAAVTGKHALAEAGGIDGAAVSTGPCGRAVTLGARAVALSVSTKGMAYSRGEDAISLATGWFSRAVAEGKRSVAIAAGRKGTARGVLGSLLIWIDRGEDGEAPPVVFSAVVDGKHILPGVSYKIVRGVIREEGYKDEEETDSD